MKPIKYFCNINNYITIAMKHLYSFILIVTCSLTFAQSDLFVSDDSYVFVDGNGFTSGPTVAPLFVTNDVNLQGDINTNGNSGHLYLRNEAQLLQSNGTITSTNTGDGKLSIFQTGTSNTYMYNYWCSPVGINSGGSGNTVFTPNVNFYDHIGHAIPALNPITSSLATYTTGYDGTATVALTTPQVISNYWLFTFTGTPAHPYPNDFQDWQGLGAGPGTINTGGLINGTLASGYGFTMKGNPSGAQKYDFRGRPNNGTITTILNAERETLVGNPYPSALDARAYIHDTNNAAIIDSATLSFWEQDPSQSTSHVLVNYVGGYATYTINAAGTVETFTPSTFDTYNIDGTINTTGGGSTSGKNVYRYIPVGQGFLVKGNSTGGTLRTTNSMRVFQKTAASLSEFFRISDTSENTEENVASYTEDGLFIMPEDYKRFRLNVDFKDTYTRQLLQTFHPTATHGEDYGLETRSPAALNSDVFWPQGDKAFNAQAFAFDIELLIPLVLNINQDQLIRFRIFDIQNFDESQPIFIHDIENDIYVDLRESNYEINLPQGIYTDRFEITFKSERLNIEEVITANDLYIYQNNQLDQLTISNPKLLEIKQVRLYDVTGKQIFDERDLKTEANFSFSTKSLSQGVYIANVTFADNQVVSKKIIVSNK
ncbi:T9SS type A sorting domain-containing protein [Xanthomarina spongicola]|uniref:Putative secreted protein (Por secretion system target) n=1 Tax=Xanthomarina spongicola TaxID=570520 RepID=A0A316DIF8_9FLAO|nr:T9SS type A sorting domain-containing protein [Xanthomarina spongicola]PWK17398.1 putative secreted protein (Por secretion system target) [Xanthomarina spongicola]